MNEPTPPRATGIARLEARIRGRVQGVGFRYFVRSEAQRRGLSGWVANEADGSVAVVAEGRRGELEAFAEALALGPRGALVSQVDIRWPPAAGHSAGFEVRAGGHSGD